MRKEDDAEKPLLCLECMRLSIANLTATEDEAEMRAILCKKGQSVPATATYVEVLSLFEKAEDGEFDFFEEGIQNVQYPLHPTSVLHPSETYFQLD